MNELEHLRVGLIGYPLAHSRSPQMQQAAFDALNLAVRYELWETTPDALAARVAALREPGYLGANVTIPYKSAVALFLDEITPQAQAAGGAVNTITRIETPDGVRLIGDNTDITALLQIIDEHGAIPSSFTQSQAQSGPPFAKKEGKEQSLAERPYALILGAGGAARAAIGAARMRGLIPWLVARHLASAQEALADMRCDPAWAISLDDADALVAALPQARLLINATPVGMAGTGAEDTTPLSAALLHRLPPGALVVDMVYNPLETPLLRAARTLGQRTLSGVTALLYQGAAAFTLWTGQSAPIEAMRATLLRSLGVPPETPDV